MPPNDIAIEATGLEETRRRLTDIAARLTDLSPVLKVVAAEVELRTDNAFMQGRSPAGEDWSALADSTLEARARRSSKAARRRQKNAPHRLTKGAKAKRAAFVEGYDPTAGAKTTAKALIDTGRARQSQRARVAAQSIEWSAVGYLAPHITGGKFGRPPKRNPSVFENRNGNWFLDGAMAKYMNDKVRVYVLTGELR